jgi:hypothetical protein
MQTRTKSTLYPSKRLPRNDSALDLFERRPSNSDSRQESMPEHSEPGAPQSFTKLSSRSRLAGALLNCHPERRPPERSDQGQVEGPCVSPEPTGGPVATPSRCPRDRFAVVRSGRTRPELTKQEPDITGQGHERETKPPSLGGFSYSSLDGDFRSDSSAKNTEMSANSSRHAF